MKTYNQFCEATIKDVKDMGASPDQIAVLKARQAKRGYGFQSNDRRVKNAPPKKQINRDTSSQTPQNSSAIDKVSQKKNAIVPHQGKKEKAKRVRTGAADKGSDIVRTRRGGTGKEAIGIPKKSGPGVSNSAVNPKPQRGTGSKTYDRMNPQKSTKKPISPDSAIVKYDAEKAKRSDALKKARGDGFTKKLLGKTAKGLLNVAKKARPKFTTNKISPKQAPFQKQDIQSFN